MTSWLTGIWDHPNLLHEDPSKLEELPQPLTLVLIYCIDLRFQWPLLRSDIIILYCWLLHPHCHEFIGLSEMNQHSSISCNRQKSVIIQFHVRWKWWPYWKLRRILGPIGGLCSESHLPIWTGDQVHPDTVESCWEKKPFDTVWILNVLKVHLCSSSWLYWEGVEPLEMGQAGSP